MRHGAGRSLALGVWPRRPSPRPAPPRHVAEGMEYLESKKLVHCDLAARQHPRPRRTWWPRLGDFGLAKAELKGLDFQPLPIKWTAPCSSMG